MSSLGLIPKIETDLQPMQIEAAYLIAEARHTHADIAKMVSVDPTTISDWKRTPEFRSAISEFRNGIAGEVLERGVAQKFRRVEKLNAQVERIERVFEGRAADPAMKEVPGGDTGLLTHDQKALGSGEFATIVDVYEFDAALAKEYRALMEHVAKELGEFEPDKAGPKGDLHQHVHIHYPQMTDAEQSAAVAAQEADMPPAAKRLLMRPSDGKPLDR